MIDPLYQKEILKLAGQAIGAGRLDRPDVTLTVKNPLCGDQIRLDLIVNEDRVETLAHETRACVLCQASASLIAKIAPGHSESDVRDARDRVATMLSGGTTDDWGDNAWEGYEVFTPVIDHANRHTCVTLPLDAVVSAFERLHGDEPERSG